MSGGRISAERLDAVAKHYAAIGGFSPYNSLVKDFTEKLRSRLGSDLPVFLGMRNWNPYLSDAIALAKRQGLRRGMGVILAPHRSQASFGRYVQSVEDAKAECGAG